MSAVEVSYVSSTMCELRLSHPWITGSKSIGQLPGSTYKLAEKRWSLPLLCLPELEELVNDCDFDDSVIEAYTVLVERLMKDFEKAGVVFSFELGRAYWRTDRIPISLWEHMRTCLEKHRSTITDILFREKMRNAQLSDVLAMSM